MQDKDTKQEVTLKVDSWLDRGRKDYDIVREVPVEKKGGKKEPSKLEHNSYNNISYASKRDYIKLKFIKKYQHLYKPRI